MSSSILCDGCNRHLVINRPTPRTWAKTAHDATAPLKPHVFIHSLELWERDLDAVGNRCKSELHLCDDCVEPIARKVSELRLRLSLERHTPELAAGTMPPRASVDHAPGGPYDTKPPQ